MSFLEIQFPTDISRGAVGGPQFNTIIQTVQSGFEQRNIQWTKARASYDVSHAIKTPAEIYKLAAFFRVTFGKAYGFRFKDWVDYTTDITTGVIGSTATGGVNVNNSGTLQLYKKYDFDGTNIYYREIKKPRSGYTIYLNGVSQGSGYTLDTTTGSITVNLRTKTIKSSVNYTVSNITSTTSITTVTTSTSTTLVTGDRIYFSGTAATTFNNTYKTITVLDGTTFTVSGNGGGSGAGGTVYRYPITRETSGTVHCAAHGLAAGGQINTWNVTGMTELNSLTNTSVLSSAGVDSFVINVNTSALTAATGGTFTIYPQNNELWRWVGEFDVPCRFDTDLMQISLDAMIAQSWNSIPIIEIRV